MATTNKDKLEGKEAALFEIGGFITASCKRMEEEDETDALASHVGNFLFSFFQFPQSGMKSNVWHYHYTMMQFFSALSMPDVSKVVSETMGSGHYSDFIEIMERLMNALQTLSEDKVLQACADFYLISSSCEKAEGLLDEFTEHYKREWKALQ